MSLLSNESVVREWFRRVWNEIDASAIDELFAPDGVAHWLGPQPVRGPAAFRDFQGAFLKNFQNIHVEILREIQVGDMIAFQAQARLIPTGQSEPITFNGGGFVRVQGKQIVETWDS